MDQLELVPDNGITVDGLMVMKQMPIIEEHLGLLKSMVDAQIEEAMGRAAIAETVNELREIRADLNRITNQAEEKRKELHAIYEKPYDDMMVTYKTVMQAFKDADKELKGKIDAITKAVIDACMDKLECQFIECRDTYGLDWMTFDRLGIKVTYTQAKQKGHKALLEKIQHDMGAISEDVAAITAMPDGPEIMAEYKRSLNMSQAVKLVQDRHAAIQAEAERAAAEKARIEAEKARQEELRKAAEPVQPPILQAPVAAPEPEKVYTVVFQCKLTLPQAVELKRWLNDRGIEWSNI